mmetsp:Transcript_32648/g.75512  ORF Transcript_32648/g.75512 Transcript_32648/m.75512 type:complete len:225 (-) Transcript_32648:263-937(-)
MHARDCEISLRKLVLQEVYLAARVAVDDGLCDSQRLVEVAQSLHLPIFLLNGDVELPDTLQGQLILLHEDAHGIPHELRGHVQDLRGHSCGEQADLNIGWQALEDVVDLVLETARHELIGLIQHEDLQVVNSQIVLAHHVIDTPWRAHHQMLPIPQLVHVITDGRAANAHVALDLEVVSQSERYLVDLVRQLACGRQDQRLRSVQRVIDALQTADHKRRCLPST